MKIEWVHKDYEVLQLTTTKNLTSSRIFEERFFFFFFGYIIYFAHDIYFCYIFLKVLNMTVIS